MKHLSLTQRRHTNVILCYLPCVFVLAISVFHLPTAFVVEVTCCARSRASRLGSLSRTDVRVNLGPVLVAPVNWRIFYLDTLIIPIS